MISIIIPVKPGLTPLAATFISRLDWPAERYELLIAEGCSPSRQRNLAAKEAKGEIIYFLDDDSLVSNDTLERLERHFSDSQVVAVGGPSLTPQGDTLLQHGFAAIFSSLLGAGGVRNRYRSRGQLRRTTERELILCNLAFRRDLFLQHGGLDERLYPNEENELLDRLQRSGHLLLHDPQMIVRRSQRKSVAAFTRQIFRYGRGRGEQSCIAGFNGIMPFVPLFFLLYLLILPFYHPNPLLLPLAIYLVTTLCTSVSAAIRWRSPPFLLLLPPLFPLMHISNGLGLLTGLLLPLKQGVCYSHLPIQIRSLDIHQQMEGKSPVSIVDTGQTVDR